MDGRTCSCWHDLHNAAPPESQLTKGIEYYNPRNKACVRKFAFTPITEFVLDNKQWEGYDEGGTIPIKIY
jgi:hypothetical protein